MNITLTYVECTRCQHKWVPRKTEIKCCPKCHSPYWDRERQIRKKKI